MSSTKIPTVEDVQNQGPRSHRSLYSFSKEILNKTKSWGNNNFNFEFKPLGNSILCDLVLKADAYVFDNKGQKVEVPMKYYWKKAEGNKTILIKEVTGNVYMPNSTDIGYKIELEALPLDSKYGKTAVHAEFGPVTLGIDIKSLLISYLQSGGGVFVCKNNDFSSSNSKNDFILSAKSSGLKLIETSLNGKENEIENFQYSFLKSSVKLDSNDSLVFTVECCKNKSANKLQNKDKVIYSLRASSRKARELLYLLIHCYVIDEKVKNEKIFSVLNFEKIDLFNQDKIFELMTQNKKEEEENFMYVKKITEMKKENKFLKKEIKSLEEDFKLTLNSLQGNFEETHQYSSSINISSDHFKDKLVKFEDHEQLKISTQEIFEKYSKLQETHSKTLQRVQDLEMQNQIMKNCLNKTKKEIQDLKSTASQSVYNVDKLKFLAAENEKLKKEAKEAKEGVHQIHANFKNKEKINKEEHTKIAEELKIQIESLNNHNSTALDELKKLKIENKAANTKITQLKEKYELERLQFEDLQHINQSKFDELEEKLNLKNKENIAFSDHNKQLIEEISEIKTNYSELKISLDSLQSGLGKSEEEYIKISKEEYEEIDSLKKEKDETEAIILHLKTKLEATEKQLQLYK